MEPCDFNLGGISIKLHEDGDCAAAGDAVPPGERQASGGKIGEIWLGAQDGMFGRLVRGGGALRL